MESVKLDETLKAAFAVSYDKFRAELARLVRWKEDVVPSLFRILDSPELSIWRPRSSEAPYGVFALQNLAAHRPEKIWDYAHFAETSDPEIRNRVIGLLMGVPNSKGCAAAGRDSQPRAQ